MITTKSKSYEEQVKLLAEHIKEAEAIVVGAASGMSAAAGYRHYYERDKDFVEYLGDFEKKYGYHNSFDGFYYRYRTSQRKKSARFRETGGISSAAAGAMTGFTILWKHYIS